jgi:hypothetical protein
MLVARLSVTATSQRATLIPLLSRLLLTDNADVRSLPLFARGERLSTSSLYKLCTDGGVRDEQHPFVWCNSTLSLRRRHAPSLSRCRSALRRRCVSYASGICRSIAMGLFSMGSPPPSPWCARTAETMPFFGVLGCPWNSVKT